MRVKRDEVSPSRLGPAGCAGAFKTLSKYSQYSFELGCNDLLVPLHMAGNTFGIAEHADMAKLIDLVRSDSTKAETAHKPRQVSGRGSEQPKASLGKADLRRRGEHQGAVRISSACAGLKNVLQLIGLISQVMDGIRVIPKQPEIMRRGHQRKPFHRLGRVGLAGRI